MGRRIGWALLIAAVAGIGVIAGRSAAPASVVVTTRQAEVDAGLDWIIPEVRFDAMPCGEVFDWLHEETGANIAVNWARLEAIGVNRATPVTLTLKGTPLDRVIEQVCAQLDAGIAPVKYQADRGLVLVSTEQDLERTAFVRIYDVRDLLKQYVDEERRIEQLEGITTRPSGESGASLFGSVGGSSYNYNAVAELHNLIQEIISPESWREAGGTTGHIRWFGGRVIIVQTRDAHLKIEELLALMRSGSGEVRVP